MSIYSPLGTGKFASLNKSSERLVLFSLLRWYDTIVALILAAIMVLMIWPVVHPPQVYPEWLLLAACPLLVLAYAAYTILSNYMLSLLQIAHTFSLSRPAVHPIVLRVTRLINRLRKARNWHHVPAFIKKGYQATFLIVFLVVFMAVIRQAYIYAGLPIDEGSVWLLYVLPIQHIARAGNMRWLVAVCAMTMIAIFVLARIFDVPLLYDAERLLILKAFWLLLICLAPMLLTIYLGDREEGFRDVRKLIGKLATIHLLRDHGLANKIAETIAHELGFTYVNIFVVKISPDTGQIEGLRIIGTSNHDARYLIREGFVLEGQRGIIGSAAASRRFCLINDVRRDTRNRYVSHPAYRGTRSELALPIMFGDTILGVLDIQSAHANVFNQDDVNVLEALTTHLAVVFSASQNLLRVKGLYGVSQTATQRVVTYQEARQALHEIIKRAQNVLQADSVVLYTRDPFNGYFNGPYTVGVDSSEASPARIVQSNKRSRVHQVLRSRAVQFFQSSDHDAARVQGGLIRNGPVFVDRMSIKSSVAIPIPGSDLRAESQLGVIFVNYCSQRPRGTFTDDDIEWCESLADITSLVLRNASLFQQVILDERMNMGREIHDGLGQYASFTRMLLEQTMDEYESKGSLTDDDFKKLLYAREVSQMLQQEVNSLNGLWRDPSTDGSLFTWVGAYADLVSRIKMDCTVTTSGDDATVPLQMRHDAEVIIREAVLNADRHGEARHARIGLRIHRDTLVVRIVDDGVGFDKSNVRNNGGLANMEYRAQRWGGHVRVRSGRHDGRRTHVLVWFPLSEPETNVPVTESVGENDRINRAEQSA